MDLTEVQHLGSWVNVFTWFSSQENTRLIHLELTKSDIIWNPLYAGWERKKKSPTSNVIRMCHEWTATLQHSMQVCDWLKHTHIVRTARLQLVTRIGRGIRQMMEIPSCGSNSHSAPPLLRLGVFTPLIDSLAPFPFQESLGRLSTRLTFPRTLPSLPYPWSWFPGLRSHSWHSLRLRSLCLTGKATFTKKNKTHGIEIHTKSVVFVL